MEARDRSLVGFVAVVMTLCLLAPSLTVIAAAPAQAANTAAELLVDPADRTEPATQGGVREFGGVDRYQTALRLAERYALERGGLDSVDTVILGSGETPIDAAVAARLAARHAAPILLTPPRHLHPGVADYIEDHQVSTLIVLGGPASVSGEVLDALAGLSSEPTVRRIFGQDRFATAAAVAVEFDATSHWCGTNDTVALLASAADERLGELVAIGPLASALELPVLLTERASLPRVTAAALRHLRIERVVIVGNATVVSDDVAAQLVSAGIAVTGRISAASSETMSAAVARLMTDTCDPEVRAARYLVALAGTDAPADAVAAAPLLGLGLDGSGPVPLLFVGSRVNSSVSSFLHTTKTTVDNLKTHVDLVAIGSTSALSEASVQVAANAATTSRSLTGRITAVAGDSSFRINFTEALRTEGERFEERMRDLLYVNDTPALIVEQEATGTPAADACDAVSSVTVTLQRPLQTGDVVEMHSADEWFAADGDRRPLQATRYTVPAPRTGASAVAMEIIALRSRSEIVIAVGYDPTESDGTDSTIDPSRIRILTGRDIDVDVGAPQFAGAERLSGLAFHRLPLTVPDGYPGDSSSAPITPGGPYELALDDLVDLRGGAVTVSDTLRSGRRRARVGASANAPGVTAVRIGPANPGVDGNASTSTPDTIDDVSERAEVMLEESVHIVGNWTGSAAGAAGNGWLLDSARASARIGETASAVSRTSHPAIRVWIDTRERIILLKFIDSEDGEPPELTYGDFVRALSSNSSFTRHFLAELVNGCIDESQSMSLADDSDFTGMSSLEGGLSSVSFLVGFSDYVTEFVADSDPDVVDVGGGAGAGAVAELIDDVLGALIEDYGQAADNPPPTDDRVETTTQLPNDQVLFRFTTADPDHTIGQLVSFRRARIEVASGIARGLTPDDPATADVDESRNPAKTLLPVFSRDPLLRRGLPASAP